MAEQNDRDNLVWPKVVGGSAIVMAGISIVFLAILVPGVYEAVRGAVESLGGSGDLLELWLIGLGLATGMELAVFAGCTWWAALPILAVLDLLPLVGGLGLLRRAPYSDFWLKFYAWNRVAITAMFALLWGGYVWQEYLTAAPALLAAAAVDVGFPVFLLCWLGRRKIRRQTESWTML